MELEEAAKEVLEPLGYEVLELTIGRKGKHKNVLLRIDKLEGGVVSMEDVETATGVFSLELDRLDPFAGEYNLEVESPGPERPLVTQRHFERFSGLLAKVKTPTENFTGRITAVTADSVSFASQGEIKTLALADIQSARLAEWPDSPR